MSFSIIIPSRNISNLTACIKALRDAGETSRVIVVNDGIEWPMDEGTNSWLPADVYPGRKPFCFARNINIGIGAAGKDDVVLMNDDVLLAEGKLGDLSNWTAGGHIVSAAIRGPAHPYHSETGWSPGFQSRSFVPFVCVWVSRQLIDRIGLLDEQFTPGSYEDNDYCRRAAEAGYGTGTCYSVVVDHQTLPHTFRPAGKPDLYDLAANRKRYEDKWRGK